MHCGQANWQKGREAPEAEQLADWRRSSHLLRMPCHVHAHWNLILNWHRQERWRVDFEIGKRSRNCPRDVSLATLCFQFERNLLVLDGLASELNLQIGIDGRSDAAADSGRRVRTVTSGNSAPRVT